MKGIILAGGTGTRLYPLSKIISKQLLPVYEKPMIYYSLSTLMLCGIKDVLIISTPWDLPHFKNLLGTGAPLGISIEYREQEHPRGLPEAFIIGEDFINNEKVALILGDNLFHGDYHGFRKAISEVNQGIFKAKTFAYRVLDPQRYGIVEFDQKSEYVISIEEKPTKPKSSYAIPGFYVFDEKVAQKAKNLKPSSRGETEITDLLNLYLKEGSLGVSPISRGIAWLDTGTPKSLLEASSFIGAIEERQGLKVACLEEVAFRMGFIDKKQLENIIEQTPNSPYKQYLKIIMEEQ